MVLKTIKCNKSKETKKIKENQNKWLRKKTEKKKLFSTCITQTFTIDVYETNRIIYNL